MGKCGLRKAEAENKLGLYLTQTRNKMDLQKVGTPFVLPTMVCIGCGACHFVCPPGAIKMTEENGTRRIWGVTSSFRPAKSAETTSLPSISWSGCLKKAVSPWNFSRPARIAGNKPYRSSSRGSAGKQKGAFAKPPFFISFRLSLLQAPAQYLGVLEMDSSNGLVERGSWEYPRGVAPS